MWSISYHYVHGTFVLDGVNHKLLFNICSRCMCIVLEQVTRRQKESYPGFKNQFSKLKERTNCWKLSLRTHFFSHLIKVVLSKYPELLNVDGYQIIYRSFIAVPRLILGIDYYTGLCYLCLRNINISIQLIVFDLLKIYKGALVIVIC